jgi:hypothetical protein
VAESTACPRAEGRAVQPAATWCRRIRSSSEKPFLLRLRQRGGRLRGRSTPTVPYPRAVRATPLALAPSCVYRNLSRG